MDWITSQTDANGVKTFYPPQPQRYEDIPKCSLCGGLTQFLHFWPEILSLLKEDEKVPSFCGTLCAKQFISILKKKR